MITTLSNQWKAVAAVFLLWCLTVAPVATAAEGIFSERAQNILEKYRAERYDEALAAAEQFIKDDSSHPAGYLIKGALLQSLSESYRNDRFNDEIDENLTQAAKLGNYRKRRDEDNPQWFFISGAAYGYRGLHRSFQGKWFSAFKDGLRCKNNLKRVLELDSTVYDAYMGLGAYHYYRTVMAGSFIWLPFVSDAREQGQAELKMAIDSGILTAHLAREAMLRINYIEGRYRTLVALADSLLVGRENEPYALMFRAKGLIQIPDHIRVEKALENLDKAWRQTRFYDSLGVYEGLYLKARWQYQKGAVEKSREIIDSLLQMKDARKMNMYFKETYENAKDYSKRFK